MRKKYAIIRKESGQEDTISLRDLAPIPPEPVGSPSCVYTSENGSTPAGSPGVKSSEDAAAPVMDSFEVPYSNDNLPEASFRRSERIRSRPNRLHYSGPGECHDSTVN